MSESTRFRLALAQIDPTVGDVEGNVRLISESIERARDGGAQLVLLPELCVSGYPPEDLLLRLDFLVAVREGLDAVASNVQGI
ncbi:MAG TPA: nitrilase-related carbon-nitrogen hydrolase, partial [Solirubrobacterales bacterium]|nr:nitrilase-related carbon-nitrogen hydrolase [Solirubrobacterales bacterium]